MENDMIYYIDRNIHSLDCDMKACKIGSTRNIIARMATYTTLSIEPVIPTYYYKINKNCYDIDDMIQLNFKDSNTRKLGFQGGTELYDLKEVNNELLETFFKENEIEFNKFNGEDIKDEIYRKTTNMTSDDYDDILKENKLKSQLNQNIKNKDIIKKPYDYQTEIINKTINYFETNKKGILVEPCGIGKSLISCWIGKELNAKSILLGVPSLSLMKQWISTLKSIFPNYNYKIISCEEKRTHTSDITNFLEKYPKNCIIITTYMSSHKVLKGSRHFKFDYKILDECHHLTNTNMDNLINDTKTFIQILKIKSIKQLALTATLKEIETNNEIISNNNIEYFGEIIDRRCLYWAIDKKILCDYNIHTIVVDDHATLLSLECFNIDSDKDKRLFIAAYCALKNINDGFSKHLLIYTNTTDNAHKTIQYVNELIKNKYFNFDIFLSKYDSTMSLEEQTSVMDNFLESEFGILSSVYCLGEGWDCPKLYGQVFAENMSSNIRIVQSALRAGRKYNKDPYKKFNIIIPVLDDINLLNNDNEDFQKIKEIIYQMGQEDITVSQKIIVSRINCKKQKKLKSILTNIKDFGNFDGGLTEKIKLETKPRIQLGISYEKAKKIIQSNNNINNKEKYYELCETDNRLPLFPEEAFKSTFKNWIDYLEIKGDFYNLDECKKKVNEYLKNNIELKNIDMSIQCYNLCKFDNKFPPNGLWVDYYKLKDITDIFKRNIIVKKKIHSGLLY